MNFFVDLPKPDYDETFSSWVYRCSQHKHQITSAYHGLAVSRIESDNYVAAYEDPDFDCEGDFYKTAARILRRDASKLHNFFKPRDPWVLPWNNRNYFCPDCLSEDVARNKPPIWRKSWCYVTTTHCHYHKRQLSYLSAQPTLSKAWEAFRQASRGRVNPDMCYDARKWLSEPACKLRYLMCLKVTNWIGYHSQGEKAPFNKATADEQYVTCFKGVMELLLQAGSSLTAPGYAKYAFKLGKTINKTPFLKRFPDIWRIGALLSSAHDRMSAVMLAGWIMSLFSDAEMKLIYSIFEKTGFSFPDNKEHVAIYGLSLEDRPTYRKMRSMFYPLKLEVLNRAGEYLSAIESHCLRFTQTGWGRKPNKLLRWSHDPYAEPPPGDR